MNTYAKVYPTLDINYIFDPTPYMIKESCENDNYSVSQNSYIDKPPNNIIMSERFGPNDPNEEGDKQDADGWCFPFYNAFQNCYLLSTITHFNSRPLKENDSYTSRRVLQDKVDRNPISKPYIEGS